MDDKQFTVVTNNDDVLHTGADDIDFANNGSLINLTKDGVIQAAVPQCNVKYILWESNSDSYKG